MRMLEEGAEGSVVVHGCAVHGCVVHESIPLEKVLNTAEMNNNQTRVLDVRQLYEIQWKSREQLCRPDVLVPTLP